MHISEQEARGIGVEAYIYAYPTVLMDITQKQATNVEEPGQVIGRTPVNQIAHAREFPDASFKDVVRPNVDTLYSFAWLDLSQEPMVLSVPDTAGRYYLLELLDYWTDVFDSPGTRTTGNSAGEFALVGPHWSGELPKEAEMIRSPTNMVWMVGRIQTNGKADYQNVHRIQDGLKLTPLSKWGQSYAPEKGKIDPSVDMKTPPLEQSIRMSAAQFFERFAELMKGNPPHQNDYPIIHRMKRIGIVPGEDFSMDSVSPEVRKALESCVMDAQKLIADKTKGLAPMVNNWQVALIDIGTYGADYLQRAAVAYFGLGANVPEDAVYPTALTDSEGRPLTGKRNYVIHFDENEIPPVNAFWSLTMYGADQALVENSLDRYALGDRDKLQFNDDGSLDIYIQHESTGTDRESNWLPAPEDSFSMNMRLYWPKMEVLNGTWKPASVLQVTAEMEAEEQRLHELGRSWSI